MTPAAAGPFETATKLYEKAFEAGDVSALAGLYTDHPVFMPPDGPNATDAEGIKSYYRTLFSQFTTGQVITVDESRVLGDWAFGRGAFVATFTPKTGGKPLEIHGKWMNMLAHQPDGSWKIARHIWNLATPGVLNRK